MRLLYITRKYPPMVGGMESMSAALAREFSQQTTTTLITWGKSQKYLPYFMLLAFVKACYLIPKKRITHLHIGDALLSPMGLLLTKMFRVKSSINIAGLDITFGFPGYQILIPPCVAQFDKIIAISKATLHECIKRGIPQNKAYVIPCGVYTEEFITQATRNDLAQIVGQNVSQKKVLITVGRLVKRKGVTWFVENVMPRLPKETMYLIIGDGSERALIKQAIEKLHLQKQVFLLGKVPDKELKIIYNTADFFIMPNLIVPGTIEGFGIVAVEASAAGLPVIAAKLEGIKDAVLEGKTGILVESMNREEFVKAIETNKTFNRKQISQYTRDNYSWKTIGEEYLSLIR